MAQELLDFDAPLTFSNYEKFLNYIEAIPSYIKILSILLFSFFAGLIIYSKASPMKDPISGLLIVTGGWFILLMAIGFCLQIFLVISCAIIDIITKSTPKIEKLGMLSITFLLSLLSLITISILAIFIP
jgi:hypothetical protein